MQQTKTVGKTEYLPPRQKLDLPLLIIVLILVAVGLIMMYSASYANAQYYMGDGLYYIRNQAVFACFGIICMIVASYVPTKLYYRFAWPLFVVSYLLLCLTLAMKPLNNARRWIILGSITFQPSEIMKFAVIVVFSWMISRFYDKMHKMRYGLFPFLTVLMMVALIMILQPHLSGTILILLIGVVLMFVGGAKIKWFLTMAAAGIPAVIAYIALTGKVDYAMDRISIWLNPLQDPRGKGYQISQSLYAIGSGGLFGLGLGNSRQKHLYVPEPQNDFIFSIICEELGFIGAVLIIILFAVFVFRGFYIARNAKDRFSALLATGITAQIGLQAVLNIAVVSGVVPNTGISLPFFSQGGTSLMILLAETGVLLSISRYSMVRKN